MTRLNATRIAAAWHSVKDGWFVRLYKGLKRPWQVCVHTDADIKVLASFSTEEAAEARCRKLENEARGNAVLKAIRELSK